MAKHTSSLIFVALLIPSFCEASEAHPGRNDAADLADIRATCDAARHKYFQSRTDMTPEQRVGAEKWERESDAIMLIESRASLVKDMGRSMFPCSVQRRIAQLDGAKLIGAPASSPAPAATPSQTTTPIPAAPPQAKASPVAAAAPKTPPKSPPTPHLSDDQLVLNEMLRQQKEKADATRKARIAHIHAEALRHDAITLTAENMDTRPVFRLKNNTDIILGYTLTWEISIGGGPFEQRTRSFVLAPFETEAFEPDYFYGDEPIRIRDNSAAVKWAAHPWNFNHL